MSDIVAELRERALRAEQDGEPITLLDEAADEITRLRSEKASDWRAACESAMAASAEIARLRLTDEEREAVAAARDYMTAMGCRNTVAQRTIAAFLERIG